MRRFRVYYGSGLTFAENPFEAPSDDVQVIVMDDPDNGRFLLAQRDYYWFDVERGQFFGGDLFGLFDYLRQPGPRKVLFGRFIPNREYQACVRAALADPSFAPKSANHPEEIY